MKPRRGAALLELLTALTLLGLLATVCAVLIHSQSTLVRSISEQAAADETLRITRLVMRAEFQDHAAADLRAVTTDSVAARVFRAWAIVCARDSVRTVLRYYGIRKPEADKDSLLVIGDETAVAFTETAAPDDACALLPGEERVAIRPARQLRLNSVVLLFESGAYHLSTRALRYRRGLEGRQPITDELLDDGGSAFIAAPDARAVVVKLRSRPRIAAARTLDARIGFRNRPP